MSRGQKKMTLRDFIREHPSEEDEHRFREAMNAKSDLVTGMIQAIEVDYALERALIMTFARTDQTTIDLLSKDNAPLGSFFGKIVLGYAMGLYDDAFMEYLNVIRRIRNAFAHGRKDVSFATPLLRAEMASIKLPSVDKPNDEHKHISIIKSLTVPPPREATRDILALTGRAAYVILCLWTLNRLLKTGNAVNIARAATVPRKVGEDDKQ